MNKKTGIDPIGWSLQNPFPETMTVGSSYEEVYQLVSNLPATMPVPLTVTCLGGNDFTVEDRCSGLHLVPGQICNITVRFTPSSAGVQQFQMTLHYFSDVVPLPVQTLTATGSNTTLIVGSVTQPLPAVTIVESKYPVTFTFQNVGTTNATNLILKRKYPVDFTEENNTCTSTLAAGASCTLSGSLVPSNPENYEVAAALYYVENEMPTLVSTHTEAIAINITGEVTTPLPALANVGESFPVEFTYTNNSALPVTDVTITTDYPTGFTEQSDNCIGTLNAHSSCTIQGIFTPATLGNFTVGESLACAESKNKFPLSTSTSVINKNEKPCKTKIYIQVHVYIKFIFHISHKVICGPPARRQGENEVRSRGARDRRALTGEAGNASRRKVIVGDASMNPVRDECASDAGRSRPNDSRVMRANFGDTMAEIFREHSDSLAARL